MGHLILAQSHLQTELLSDWLDRQVAALAIPTKLAYAVRLCLEEAVDNLIRYTSSTPEGPRVRLEVDWSGDVLVAVVEDYGLPFDPRTVAPYSPAKDLETANVGSWGIHLIRSYADEIEYQAGPDSNRLTLRFNRGATTQAVPTPE